MDGKEIVIPTDICLKNSVITSVSLRELKKPIIISVSKKGIRFSTKNGNQKLSQFITTEQILNGFLEMIKKSKEGK